jgi:acetylornithine deacetylase/succinyl-diaminopimelate desuccinylase family protein
MKDEILRILRKLIEKDTTNPPGNEYRAAEVVKEFFEKYDIKYKIFEKEKGRTNIIGYIGKGKEKLFIACHLDTVPVGNGWKTNPFKAVEKFGRIYGRGASDNKGPLASILITAKRLKAVENRLKGRVLIAGVADEERGSEFGVKFLLNKNLINPEYAIIPDVGHRMKVIDVAEKGLLFLRITSYGKQAHGSRPERGVNAVWNMIDFLNLFRNYKMNFKKHPLLSDPTINLGAIKGGETFNMVPSKCEAYIDIRYLPSQSSQEIIEDVKKMINFVKKRNKKAKFKIEIFDKQSPMDIQDNILINLIKRNSKKILGFEPKNHGMSGSTVTKFFAKKGIKAVGYGSGSECAHMANEYVEIKDLINFSEVLYNTVLDLML